jgi:hypothetical protein
LRLLTAYVAFYGNVSAVADSRNLLSWIELSGGISLMLLARHVQQVNHWGDLVGLKIETEPS